MWLDSCEDFGDGSSSLDAFIPASSDTLIWGATIGGLMVHKVEVQAVVFMGGNDRYNNSQCLRDFTPATADYGA